MLSLPHGMETRGIIGIALAIYLVLPLRKCMIILDNMRKHQLANLWQIDSSFILFDIVQLGCSIVYFEGVFP